MNVPFHSESYNCQDGGVCDGLLNDNLDITCQVTEDPGVLVPHLVQLTGHGKHQGGHVCHRQVQQVHIGRCPTISYSDIFVYMDENVMLYMINHK